MPETTPEKSPADAWSGAYQAATEQLRGLGPNEPQKTRGKDKPSVMLELITMDGQRFIGAATIDPRMSLGVDATDPSIAAEGFRPGVVEPEASPEVVHAGVRDFIASLNPGDAPNGDEAKFFADVLAEDEARIARQASASDGE